MSTNVPWPPNVGELVARAAEAFGVRYKLQTYSLDINHDTGGPKARGFEQILGITIDAIDYLEAQILARLLETPVSTIEENPPYGVNCVVDMPIAGIGAKADRVANVRTVWAIEQPGAPPRLVSAYPKPSYGDVVVNWVRRRMVWWLTLAGRSRGGTGGRSSLIDCGVRLIYEGFTSRPGVRRGSPSRNGHCQPMGLAAHRAFASLRATVLGLPGARARPENVPGAMVGVLSVKCCCLP